MISVPINELLQLECKMETRFGICWVHVASFADPEANPAYVIATTTGNFLSGELKAGMTLGVGPGRTLFNILHKSPDPGWKAFVLCQSWVEFLVRAASTRRNCLETR